ncbi:MAG: 3-phosphoshikimate 1-carboxyvinyltransferase [Vulcanimicrobiaceae bacterium]
MGHETLTVDPLRVPVRGDVRVPGSKSITNRALLLAALAQGPSMLEGALESDDTTIFAGALAALGIAVAHDRASETFAVDGTGGTIPAPDADLFVGNAGTAARFITAFVALGTGTYRFDGVPAMRARPVGELLDVVRAQGARVDCTGEPNRFPFVVHARGLPGGDVTIDARKTSQQISALLLVAPYARDGMELHLTGELVSEPYVDMTCEMMAQWGVRAERRSPRDYVVAPGGRYEPRTYAIEPDASSASYFFAAAAASGGRVAVRGMRPDALQGDARFVRVLERMGARVDETSDGIAVTGPATLRGIEVDMNAISDTAPTLAAIAPFAQSPVRITGVEHMRWKETDRIAAMTTELRKMGARVDEAPDGMTVYPSRLVRAQVATYDDHRMAMSLAIAGLLGDGVVIEDPACTSKTFAGFWDVLAGLSRASVPHA